MRITWKWLVIPMLLCGCPHHYVATHRDVISPDGDKIHEAFCSGNHLTFGDCMNEAGRTCGGPYDILASDKETVVSSGSSTTSKVGTTYITNSNAYSLTSRQMFFRCKNRGLEAGIEAKDDLQKISEESKHAPPQGDQCLFEEDCMRKFPDQERQCKNGYCMKP